MTIEEAIARAAELEARFKKGNPFYMALAADSMDLLPRMARALEILLTANEDALIILSSSMCVGGPTSVKAICGGTEILGKALAAAEQAISGGKG